MIRLFVAFELPEMLRDRLAALQSGVPGARWTEFDNFHLTLRFIGEVDEPVAADIDLFLEDLRHPPFAFTLEGMGAFGGAKPRALYAGIAPCDPLKRLQAKIETGFQRLGLPPEERKFTPHVTLARLNRDVPAAAAMQFVAAHNLFAWGPVPATQITLFSSHLHREGSRYVAERRYSLRDKDHG